MLSLALCALAGTGAARHFVPLAEHLVGRGHRVTVLSAPEAREQYAGIGVEFVPVPEGVMPALSPHLPPLLGRARQVHERVRAIMIDPLPQQWRALREVVEQRSVDVAVGDGFFFGLALLLLLPRSDRPAVVGLGQFPPVVPDPLVPPFGLGLSPTEAAADRVRAAVLQLLAGRSYARLSREFSAAAERLTGTPATGDIRNAYDGAEAWAQLTVPRFEYPRAVEPANFHFVGPLRPTPAETVPEWWDPAAEPPVVVVGVDPGAELTDLVVPAIRAFGGDRVTVLIVGVEREEVSAGSAASLPSNVHFEREVPWSRLIPGRSVLVSTGDYMEVQHALRRGVPVVVAGTLEPNVETGARVRWAGVGVDLRTRAPSPESLRDATAAVLHDPEVRRNAAMIAAQIAATDAERAVADLVERAAQR